MPQIRFEIVEVVVFRNRRLPEFLILKRSGDEDIYPGLWQIVSGGIERYEKAYEAAIREMREEIGITPLRLFNTPLTNTFYFAANDSVNVSPVLAAEVDEGSEVKLSSEHEAYRWATSEEAISSLVWPGQKEAIKVVKDFVIDENPSRKFMQIKFRE